MVENLMVIFFACVCSLGLVGCGSFILGYLQKEYAIKESVLSNEEINPFLKTGVSWFLGYLFLEIVLYILALVHLLNPIAIILVLLLIAFLSLRSFKNRIIHAFKWQKLVSLETAVLCFLSLFVLVWNFYPTYDVDSLASYFVKLKMLMTQGLLSYSPYSDIRFMFPMGENMIYAIGFALTKHPFTFAQVLHGFSKVFFIISVYGACRHLKLGVLALLAPALIMSEEHLMASGANSFVHINIFLAEALFLFIFGFFIFVIEKRPVFLILSFISVIGMMISKYFGILYFIIFVTISLLTVFLNSDLKKTIKTIFKAPGKSLLLIFGILIFGLIPYWTNWYLTGSPVYPVSIGPFHATYDALATEAAKLYHYHVSLFTSLKMLSSFMVWPGVLALKLLLFLVITASLLHAIAQRELKGFFLYGLIFTLFSVLIVLIQENYIVYEMRYYRFGIGVYAMAFIFLLTSIIDLLAGSIKLSNNHVLWIKRVLLAVMVLYCMKYSFDVMGETRPNLKKIIEFVKGDISEQSILDNNYPRQKEAFDLLEKLQLNNEQLLFMTKSSWPQSLYYLKGKDISFLKSNGLPSCSFFDEGCFAQELLNLKAQYIFDEFGLERQYPDGGIATKVIKACGKKMDSKSDQIFELSRACLEKLAVTKNCLNGQTKAQQVILDLKKSEKYEPFNVPAYGVKGLFS